MGTPHRVAVLVPTTGANAGVGQSIANAANLALLDTGGGRIRLTVYDTTRGAAAAAAQAIADGNRLFLGPLLAEDVRVATPASRRAGSI
jgi:outer membrane PBP1 activator LpoA protein